MSPLESTPEATRESRRYQFKLWQLLAVVGALALLFGAIRWFGSHLAVPFTVATIAHVAMALAGGYTQASIPKRQEGIWLVIGIGASIVLAVYWYFETLLHDMSLGGVDTFYVVTLPFAAGGASLCMMGFLFGIPSRVAMNMIVASRRWQYRYETVACVFAFVAVCWLAYTVASEHLVLPG